MKYIFAAALLLAATAFAQTANQQPNHQTLEGDASVCPKNWVCGSGTMITITAPPVPTYEWVPDPSAGHYDCTEGYTAMESVEPQKYSDRFQSVPAVYIITNLDKKGHVLGNRPAPPICVKDVKP
jgi:hypothetical protein